MAFLAVLREGFETAVFLLATFHASGDATLTWLGAVIGILLAVVLGYGIYRGGVRLNLSRFFRITGIVLVVVAAGLVMTAFHTANEAGWLTFGQAQAFDLSWLVRPGTPLSSLVTGVLGIQPYPAWIEVIAWLAYLVPMVVIVAWPPRDRRATPAAAAEPARSQPSRGRHHHRHHDTGQPTRHATRRVTETGRRARSRQRAPASPRVAGLACWPRACASSAGHRDPRRPPAAPTTVNIDLTPQGCAPKPAKVTAGQVQFNVANKTPARSPRPSCGRRTSPTSSASRRT